MAPLPYLINTSFLHFFQDLDSGLGNFRKFTALKSQNRNLKLLLGVGGWTDSQNNMGKYREMMGSAANRAAFLR